MVNLTYISNSLWINRKYDKMVLLVLRWCKQIILTANEKCTTLKMSTLGCKAKMSYYINFIIILLYYVYLWYLVNSFVISPVCSDMISLHFPSWQNWYSVLVQIFYQGMWVFLLYKNTFIQYTNPQLWCYPCLAFQSFYISCFKFRLRFLGFSSI